MKIFCRYILAAAATAVWTGGCGVGGTFGAKQLIEPETEAGKSLLRLTLGSDWLVKQGRINAHRRILATDGTELDVWVINARVTADKATLGATALVIHPLTTSKAWFLSLGEELARAGWDVILPDIRVHGSSGGTYITWGAVEKHDMKEIVDALVDEGLVAPRIYALGSSLGGCIAIQYAAVDPRCEGVMALASPTGIEGAARLFSPLSTDEAIDSAVSRAGMIAGFNPNDASALDAAAKLNCPLILVHGIWDIVVPYRHSEQIYKAAKGPKKLIPLYLGNHTSVQVGRDWWIVKKMQLLMEMARRPKAEPAGRSAPAAAGRHKASPQQSRLSRRLPADREGGISPPRQSDTQWQPTQPASGQQNPDRNRWRPSQF